MIYIIIVFILFLVFITALGGLDMLSDFMHCFWKFIGGALILIGTALFMVLIRQI